jgi:hypothetical protein
MTTSGVCRSSRSSSRSNERRSGSRSTCRSGTSGCTPAGGPSNASSSTVSWSSTTMTSTSTGHRRSPGLPGRLPLRAGRPGRAHDAAHPGQPPAGVRATAGGGHRRHRRREPHPAAQEAHRRRGPRLLVSFDRDARWGHRTATDRRPTEHFLGYEAHLATYAPRVGSEPIPQSPPASRCARGSATAPGLPEHRRHALPAFTEILLDRGYTTAKGSQLAGPLRDRDITLTMDLHKTQRVVAPARGRHALGRRQPLLQRPARDPPRTLEPPTAG